MCNGQIVNALRTQEYTCQDCGIVFGVKNLNLEEIKGKKIIEVGAYDVNGSLRPIIESWAEPAEYIGVDIVRGPGVDVVCMAERMINVFVPIYAKAKCTVGD